MTCVNFIGYDIYDHTQLPARWSIKLSHTAFQQHIFPVLDHLAPMCIFLLHFSQAHKRIYKQTEGFMKDA